MQVKDYTILVVDDEKDIRDALQIMLSGEGFDVKLANSSEAALEILEGCDCPLIISDIMMPGMSGIELLQKVKLSNPESEVVLMTGYSSVQSAIDSIKAGAQDYLIKPVNYKDVLLMVERNHQQHLKNKRSQMMLQEMTRSKTDTMVGSSAGIRQVKDEITQVAPSDISVLVTGESGTGKELVARAIHEMSPRCDKMFVAINCASIPSDLLESELFGHERGAFSGAVARKYGLFEVADQGTLLLDEIGEMQLDLQAKILRTIETGLFRRLGSTKELSSNFRIVAATNSALQEAIAEKRFRSDLYYRLNQFSIHVPPLRKRKNDISELVEFFAARKGRTAEELDEKSEFIQMLKQYHWPGNVRELFNTLERAFLLAGQDIPSSKHFPPEIRRPSDDLEDPSNGVQSLQEIENQHIVKIYNELGFNKSKTAKALGISVRSLYSKLKDLNITD